MDVALIRWPQDSRRVDELRRQGAPRLLLVAATSRPPQVMDVLEDWIRLPADDADIRTRVETLERRSVGSAATAPTLDDDGIMRYADRWVSLPPVEARLAAELLDRLGAVVARDALTEAGWPSDPPGRNALDVHVLRLRRRLATVGLVIRTVRSRGYLLEPASEADDVRLASDTRAG